MFFRTLLTTFSSSFLARCSSSSVLFILLLSWRSERRMEGYNGVEEGYEIRLFFIFDERKQVFTSTPSSLHPHLSSTTVCPLLLVSSTMIFSSSGNSMCTSFLLEPDWTETTAETRCSKAMSGQHLLRAESGRGPERRSGAEAAQAPGFGGTRRLQGPPHGAVIEARPE
ncbi:hypothetical protein EYF80_037169 [Liparis tanakae]|uniref:Uncharacterized protein n=1 Tax=Liparis tanakae TaxID=230148 RepID=A0A4Z2GHC1_9TELE|nr:hypothetical protein EYF80_037169 [Liparis tanakae]